MSQLNLIPKKGSRVLWLDNSHERNNVEEASVIGVWGTPETPIFGLVWLDGYKSRNDDVSIDRILAIHDPTGPEMTLSNFNGRGYITEAGYQWQEANSKLKAK